VTFAVPLAITHCFKESEKMGTRISACTVEVIVPLTLRVAIERRKFQLLQCSLTPYNPQRYRLIGGRDSLRLLTQRQHQFAVVRYLGATSIAGVGDPQHGKGGWKVQAALFVRCLSDISSPRAAAWLTDLL
jgi:hypothetical protein